MLQNNLKVEVKSKIDKFIQEYETTLTQKKPLFIFALVISLIAMVFGLSGFLGLNLHPDRLAKLLG